MTITRISNRGRAMWFAGIALSLGQAGGALAEDRGPEPIAPGVVSPLPGKGFLPRREGLLALTVGGSALISGSPGAEGFLSLRFIEAFGLEVGARGTTDGTTAFLRMDGIGLVINHWAFLGYAEIATTGAWTFGGAVDAPLHYRDTYLRLSLGADTDGHTSAGVGMEYDLW